MLLCKYSGLTTFVANVVADIKLWSSIFELTHRTLPALLNTTLIILSPFITTLKDWWWSPMHLLFTYIVPIIPLFYAIDGYVSCARCRTPDETWDLLRKSTGLSVNEWEQQSGWQLKSGQQVVIPPFGTLYWYAGVKTSQLLTIGTRLELRFKARGLRKDEGVQLVKGHEL